MRLLMTVQRSSKASPFSRVTAPPRELLPLYQQKLFVNVQSTTVPPSRRQPAPLTEFPFVLWWLMTQLVTTPAVTCRPPHCSG